jgi:hypothetical protein
MQNLNPNLPNKVFHIRSVSLPEYLFEYHPWTRKAYYINTGKTVATDERLAHEGKLLCDDPVADIMAFKALVQAFVQGYKQGYETPARLLITHPNP